MMNGRAESQNPIMLVRRAVFETCKQRATKNGQRASLAWLIAVAREVAANRPETSLRLLAAQYSPPQRTALVLPFFLKVAETVYTPKKTTPESCPSCLAIQTELPSDAIFG